MTSIVDNGNGNTSTMDMPQWKRDLIMRRRAQQQAAALNKDNAVAVPVPPTTPRTINKQLSVTSTYTSCNQSKSIRRRCSCSNCSRVSTSPSPHASNAAAVISESSSVALGYHPPLGHQPNSTSSSSGGCCSSCYRGNINSSISTSSSCSSCGVGSSCAGCCATATATASACGIHRNSCTSITNAANNTCCNECNKMVHLHNDSDSSEELQYGPGIVNKLKNRYLSLTLRETTTKRRPSILRKSTSLENLLDDDQDYNKYNGQTPLIHEHDKDAQQQLKQSHHRLYETRTNGTNGNVKNVHVPSSNRYHHRNATTRGMKRARSVEAISRIWSPSNTETSTQPQQQQQPEQINGQRPKSLQEEFQFAINPIITPRINKPTRIKPVITEREKPPADVVKQTKKIFEARPESRTKPPQHTGDVAAKVATYKTIIIQNKQSTLLSNKPPIKQKPTLLTNDENNKNVRSNKPNIRLNLKPAGGSINTSPLTSPLSPVVGDDALHSNGIANPNTVAKSLPSPIPDVSMVQEELDDKKSSNLSETPDLILHSSPVHVQNEENDKIIIEAIKNDPNIDSKSTIISKTEPLSLDITNSTNYSNSKTISANMSINNKDPVLVLSPREIEKNAINAATSTVINQQKPTTTSPNVININKSNIVDDTTISTKTNTSPGLSPLPSPILSNPPPTLPKAKPRKSQQQPEQNCIVFKFTDRKDVPDYIGNDGMVRTQSRIDIPKAGEGGVTLLPGTTIQDVYKDYDEELLSLEGPPSPCDVNFINDNILIEGKSSLCKKTKKPKLKIQFMETVPLVFEYPSEASMLLEDPQSLNQPLGGTTVPSLSGSTLANYTPKVASNDFQLGVTKAPPPPPPPATTSASSESKTNGNDADVIEDEHEEPMLFSSGTNSDILF